MTNNAIDTEMLLTFEVTEKICSRCNQSLPRSEFHIENAAPDKLQRWCKKCKKEHQQIKALEKEG